MRRLVMTLTLGYGSANVFPWKGSTSQPKRKSNNHGNLGYSNVDNVGLIQSLIQRRSNNLHIPMLPSDPMHWVPAWMCLLLSGRTLCQARADPEQQCVRLCQLWHGMLWKNQQSLMVLVLLIEWQLTKGQFRRRHAWLMCAALIINGMYI